MFTISTTMIMNRVLYKTLPYDADKDFVLISSMSAGHLPFVAAKATGATNLKEFAEYARKNKMSVGTYAAGSYAHISGCRAQQALRPADGSRALPRRGTDVAGSCRRRDPGRQRQLRRCIQRSAVGRRQGDRRAADQAHDASCQTSATFLEQGVTCKAFQLKGFICLVGPTGMPQEIVQNLSDLMVEGGKSERVRRLLDTFGVDEAAVGHQEFRKLYDEEGPIWISLVQGLGLTPQ